MGYGSYQGEEASSFLSFESRGEILDSRGDPLSRSMSRSSSRSLRLSEYFDMMSPYYFPFCIIILFLSYLPCMSVVSGKASR